MHQLTLILKHLNDGDTFLNIGAHIGTFVIYANKLKQLKQTIPSTKFACIKTSNRAVDTMVLQMQASTLQPQEANVQLHKARHKKRLQRRAVK